MVNKNTIRLTESELKSIIIESVQQILKENNYKSKYHKMIAAMHAAGVPDDKRHERMDTWFAKNQAVSDINKDRRVFDMEPHEKEFNNAIKNNTFDIDFGDLDYVDDYYM